MYRIRFVVIASVLFLVSGCDYPVASSDMAYKCAGLGEVAGVKFDYGRARFTPLRVAGEYVLEKGQSVYCVFVPDASVRDSALNDYIEQVSREGNAGGIDVNCIGRERSTKGAVRVCAVYKDPETQRYRHAF